MSNERLQWSGVTNKIKLGLKIERIVIVMLIYSNLPHSYKYKTFTQNSNVRLMPHLVVVSHI